MKNHPKISIIIPVYNVEKYLIVCIESILEQTFEDFELLLIDDGSSDSSGEICDCFAKKDSRIEVFHTKNQGVSSARNFGIEKSKGDYICFIDSDDFVASFFLANFYFSKFEADFYTQGYALVFGDKKCRDQKMLDQTGFYTDFTVPFKYLISDNQSACAKLFKSSIIKSEKIHFDINLNLGEDQIFVLNYFLRAKSFYLSDSCGYFYRKGVLNSLTSRPPDYSKFVCAITTIYELRKAVLLEKNVSNSKLSACIESQYLSSRIDCLLMLCGHRSENALFRAKAIIDAKKQLEERSIQFKMTQPLISKFTFFVLFNPAPLKDFQLMILFWARILILFIFSILRLR